MFEVVFWIRWALASLFLFVFAWCTCFNCWCVWRECIRKEPVPSLVPFVGGLFGVCGLNMILLDNSLLVICLKFLPAFIDVGCFVFFIVVLTCLRRRRLQ